MLLPQKKLWTFFPTVHGWRNSIKQVRVSSSLLPSFLFKPSQTLWLTLKGVWILNWTSVTQRSLVFPCVCNLISILAANPFHRRESRTSRSRQVTFIGEENSVELPPSPGTAHSSLLKTHFKSSSRGRSYPWQHNPNLCIIDLPILQLQVILNID